MNIKARLLMSLLLGLLSFSAQSAYAHSGDIIASSGTSNAIDVTVIDSDVTEWTSAGAIPTTIDNGHPNTAEVYAVHRADGIYLRLEISDGIPSNFDAIFIYFDLAHDVGGTRDGNDWGVNITRDSGITKWGAGDTPSTGWDTIPAAFFGVSPFVDPALQDCIQDPVPCEKWIVELKLPSGLIPPNNTHTLDFATDFDPIGGGKIGTYIQIFNQFEGFDLATIYNQWPDVIDNLPIDANPSLWGNYQFDPTTTFSDVAVTYVRQGIVPENYRKIRHASPNSFHVGINNPVGPVLPAKNTRLNLYLAARGIGESWHRIDTPAVLDADCSAATWASSLIDETEVCSGATSLPDISSKSLASIVDNTAKYTIKNGQPMTRFEGVSETIATGVTQDFHVLDWDTTSTQDDRFMEVEVPPGSGTTYNRQHQCMKAEAIVPNDPNTTNNLRQVNMDFVCVPQQTMQFYPFTLGWAGFSKYDPGAGKKMFLHVQRRNMDEKAGWAYHLRGVAQIKKDVFVAPIKGKKSLPVTLAVAAPSEKILGRPLKQNLMVPPKAGGNHANVKKPSGDRPVYVKVQPNSTLLIANYAFDEKDIQWVDMDGKKRKLPPNGPTGLVSSYVEKDSDRSYLLVPHLERGALIGSIDNFKTAFLVGEGVQLKVPPTSSYLALGINELRGKYDDNIGTGFRVKVTQKPDKRRGFLKGLLHGLPGLFESEAWAMGTRPVLPAKVATVPIQDVMPTLCIQGYENIGQKRLVGGKPHELYRFLGDVCWGILNVYDRERPRKPEPGDPFREPPRKSWWDRFKDFFSIRK